MNQGASHRREVGAWAEALATSPDPPRLPQSAQGVAQGFRPFSHGASQRTRRLWRNAVRSERTTSAAYKSGVYPPAIVVALRVGDGRTAIRPGGMWMQTGLPLSSGAWLGSKPCIALAKPFTGGLGLQSEPLKVASGPAVGGAGGGSTMAGCVERRFPMARIGAEVAVIDRDCHATGLLQPSEFDFISTWKAGGNPAERRARVGKTLRMSSIQLLAPPWSGATNGSIRSSLQGTQAVKRLVV